MFFRNLFNGLATKAVFAALAAAGSGFVAASADGILEGREVGEIVAAFLVGLGFTYAVPFAGALKAIVSTGVSVLGALTVALDNGGGIDGNEWYAIVTIVFAAFGTFVFPNARASEPVPA